MLSGGKKKTHLRLSFNLADRSWRFGARRSTTKQVHAHRCYRRAQKSFICHRRSRRTGRKFQSANYNIPKSDLNWAKSRRYSDRDGYRSGSARGRSTALKLFQTWWSSNSMASYSPCVESGGFRCIRSRCYWCNSPKRKSYGSYRDAPSRFGHPRNPKRYCYQSKSGIISRPSSHFRRKSPYYTDPYT